MTLSSGQRLALRQTQAVAAAQPDELEILAIREPKEAGRPLELEVSVNCRGFGHQEGGLRLRERERLLICVPGDFPFRTPSLWTLHRRWAGAPHVQWGRSLCLYQAPSVEWLPNDGMYGFLDRVELWLRKAATGDLDPAGTPLHPPVAYVSRGAPLVIPRVDTPPVVEDPWLGWVDVETHGDRRIDLRGWTATRDEQGAFRHVPKSAGAAFLLPSAMDWEYPEHGAALLLALIERGIGYGDLMLHLKLTTLGLQRGEPMLVIVGSAMRGVGGQQPRQHLAAWRIPSETVDQLRLALGEYLDDEQLRVAGREAWEQAFKWLSRSEIEWCPVREDRPEIVTRRDAGSPIEAFANKRVMIWGAGALGGPVAHWIARAGASELTIVDSATVTPGILVRQPYTDTEIGHAKADALAAQLRAVRPGLQVTAQVRDLRNVLNGPDWHGDADVIVDCSASLTVQTKLESVRRQHASARTTIVTMLVGHTAQNGLAVVARPEHSGASGDVLRAVKLECLRRRELRGFAEEFWPGTPRGEHFQPEPGCSDATFRGSGAEANALAGSLLAEVARDLKIGADEATAVGYLLALPGAAHDGQRNARLAFEAARTTTVVSGDYEIRVSTIAARELQGWIRQAGRRIGTRSETGGLVFGQRDDAAGVIWIDRLSGPPPDSEQSPAEFVCGTAGVEELCHAHARLGRGSLEFLGMWHTHPDQSSAFSRRDLGGMAQLLAAAPSPLPQGLILIVGHASHVSEQTPGPADISAYTFDGAISGHAVGMQIAAAAPLPLTSPTAKRDVGLALSGGGARAIAFHLGCLRALHDRGILDRIRVISGVSGGSVLGALYAYSDDNFEQFDRRVCEVLRDGLQADIARRALLSRRLPQGLATRVVAGTSAGAARALSIARRKVGHDATSRPPLRRWINRSDAFSDVLARRLFGDLRMPAVRRPGVDIVINACDLTTGSAFRFGSRESGTWRIGTLADNSQVTVSEAVAASAAYPLLLPALDRKWHFEKRDGTQTERRVVLSDGGIFDNLGTTCLEPGRSERYSTNVFDVDHIIACDAGRGLLDPEIPFGGITRLSRTFTATFRKAQDATRARLHALVEHGQLKGFAMPYLGQQDSDKILPYVPADLVRREDVVGYPTDFRGMSDETIALLANRGEQLTRLLIERWTPGL